MHLSKIFNYFTLSKATMPCISNGKCVTKKGSFKDADCLNGRMLEKIFSCRLNEFAKELREN